MRVGKIVCLGANYTEHMKEIREEPSEKPLLFLKPATEIIHSGDAVEVSSISSNLHHEIELVAVISREGKNVTKNKAMEYVGGYAVGLDMTPRPTGRCKEEWVAVGYS